MAKDKETCSKCSNEPRVEGSSWGKACLAEKQRLYRESVEGKAEAQGFAAGAEAFRTMLVGNLRKAPATGLMMTGEVVSYIVGLPAPSTTAD